MTEADNNDIETCPYTGFPIVYQMTAGYAGSDRRFPHLERTVSLDENGKPFLTFFLPSIKNQEVENALGLSGTEISKKYIEALAERLGPAYGAEPSVEVKGETVGVTIPLDYNLAHARDSLVHGTNRFTSLSTNDEVVKAVYDKTLLSENPSRLEESIIYAKHDLLGAIAPKSLHEAAQASLDVLMSKKEQSKESAFGDQTEESLKKLLEDTKITEEIAKQIAPEGRGIAGEDLKFTLAGTGHSGTFFKTNIPGHGEVVVALRPQLYDAHRAPIPTQLQALKEFEVGKFKVEITPAVNTKQITQEQALDVQRETEKYYTTSGRQYFVEDKNLRNFGASDTGKAYYLDGDGMATKEMENVKQNSPDYPNKYVREDGTWEQYHDFQALHQAYDSPLHQQGAKLSPDERQATPVSPSSPAELAAIAVAAPIAATMDRTDTAEPQAEEEETVAENTTVLNQNGEVIKASSEMEQTATSPASTTEDPPDVETSNIEEAAAPGEKTEDKPPIETPPAAELPKETSNPAVPAENQSTEEVEANSNAKEDKKNGFNWSKTGIMLGALGTAAFIGKNKQPENHQTQAEQQPEKQGWFKRNVKMFAKALLCLIAIDMGQSMVRGTQSYTSQAAEKIGIGDFTNKILAERENNTRTHHLG